jgi:hypothetical protein
MGCVVSWTITLQVADCSASGTRLSGATISLGSATLGSTDVNGEFLATLDDYSTHPIFKIVKENYIADNFAFNIATDRGTHQNVCLQPSPIPPGHDPNVPTGEGQSFDGGCFIVSATTGSADSAEVHELRRLRDRIAATSLLGRRLIDVIYEEYFQFSPEIADKLRQDDLSRSAALRLAVRPLLAWYGLAGELALGRDPAAIRRLVQSVADSCPRYFPGKTVVTVLEAVRSGTPLPVYSPDLLADLVPKIAALSYARWAILDPLVRVWRTSLEHRGVVEEVAQWLATTPLETLTPPTDPVVLRRELKVLAAFFDFKPEARQNLGERLRVAWPDAAEALQQAGFGADMPRV